MQHDERDKISHASPPAKPAVPVHVPAHPAKDVTHQPAWTEDTDIPKHVRYWLDLNISMLSSLSLSEIVRRVCSHVPGAAKLSDSEIQRIIRQWAKDHKLVIHTV